MHTPMCMFCRTLFVLNVVLYLLAIVLSIFLRFPDSDYSFGIFKLFLPLQKSGSSSDPSLHVSTPSHMLYQATHCFLSLHFLLLLEHL